MGRVRVDAGWTACVAAVVLVLSGFTFAHSLPLAWAVALGVGALALGSGADASG